jgi:uncharacterized NAD-dependent epimerase/dehydratase family protein
LKAPALILGDRLLSTPYGKTAHGLLRQSDRFSIVGVVEAESEPGDAGIFIGRPSINIPLTASVERAIEAAGEPPRWAIVGIATPGGKMSEPLRRLVLAAVRHGLSVVNGLHDHLSDDAEIVAAAQAMKVQLLDLRKVKRPSEMSYWTGQVCHLPTARVAVLGTDCIVGKRTTANLLVARLRAHRLKAELIYTGQTGWLQGAEYGFVLDSTINDFVSGEMEAALLRCARAKNPDVMVIEGQSSMQNPSTPCGAEIILSADVHGVILQHVPNRKSFSGFPALAKSPSLDTEIRILAAYGTPLLGISLNFAEAAGIDRDRYVGELEAKYGVPVVAPLEGSIDAIVESVAAIVGRARACAG